MIVPQRRGELEKFKPSIRFIDSDPELRANYEAWAQSRKEFLEQRADGWQRDYFQGKHANGEQADKVHRTRVRLSGFEPDPGPAAVTGDQGRKAAREP
jgi:hypothetical protein